MQLKYLFVKCQKDMDIENIKIGSGGTRRRILKYINTISFEITRRCNLNCKWV